MKQFITLVFVAFHTSFAIADESAQELVNKAVARSRTIKSGCFEYFDDAQPDFKISRNFGDGRWRETKKGHIEAEYGSMRIHFGSQVMVPTPEQAKQDDAHVAWYLVPACAGSFWYQRQVDWVESHVADFEKTGMTRIGAATTVICEAYFKGPDAGPVQAFHPLVQPTYKGQQLVRKIRLYIAPSLGYVLPQYEIIGGTDTVIHRWTATNFKECSPGIFIAKHIKEEYARENELALDPATCISSARTVSADRINQPLREDDLYFEIPADTMITDAGGEEFLLYKLRDAISSKDLARLSEKVSRVPKGSRGGIKAYGLD